MAQAQSRTPSEAATAEQRLAEDVGLERLPNALPAGTTFRNVSALQQTGSNNTATISQQNPTLKPNEAIAIQAGESNTMLLNQLGSSNQLYVSQDGSGNAVGYTQDGNRNSTSITQKGNQNKVQGIGGSADLLLQGSDNTMKITQNGDNNTVEGRIQESHRKYEITQSGSENKLIQVESTMQTPVGYSVEMRGRGINLTIEQSKVLPGVK
jgi:minor curlin subunit